MTQPEDSPAVAVVDRLLRTACARGASDLHLDPSADGVRVRLRCDGALQTVETLPAELAPRLVGRCKALAELLVYRSDVPQEGRVDAARSGVARELRVATYPTVSGERVAVRLDSRDGAPRRLAELGLDAGVVEALSLALAAPDGVVLVTGPSGSGKTTTLYSCLLHLLAQSEERALVSVEDPVERRIDGVVQTEVDAVAGLDFSGALRSLLRQDPDVILIGEVRDPETARIALKAGLTGHLVLATVHAKGAAEVFARMLDLGVEPFALTTTVRGVLSQRLLRRRCPCAGAGCGRCHGSGYSGRMPVAEWLPMHEPLRAAVLARADGEALEHAARQGGTSGLREVAARCVMRGETDTKEVERVLGRN